MRAAAMAMAMVPMLAACAVDTQFTFELTVQSARGAVTLDGEHVERVERTADTLEQAHRAIEIVVVVDLPEGRVAETARPGLCDPGLYPDLRFEAVAYRVNVVAALYPQLVRKQCDDIFFVSTSRTRGE
jgi:hypothetical protein